MRLGDSPAVGRQSKIENPKSKICSSVYFPQHDVDGAEDDDGVGDGVAEAHLLEEGEIDQRGWADAVAPGVGRAVANEVETEFTLGAFEAAIGFAGFRAEAAELRLG